MTIGTMFLIRDFNKEFEGGEENGVKRHIKNYFIGNMNDFKSNNWF